MAIKNWTVTVQSTQSVAAREIYLHDAHHANHKHTDAIIDVYGSKDTSLSINRNCEAYRLNTALKRKGGRPPTPAMEFVFTLPKGQQFKPTQKQWQKMIMSVGNVIAHQAGMSEDDRKHLGGMVRAVAHQQNDCIRGAGDHCHLVFGKFTPSGKYLRGLQKKGVLYAAKQAFNKAVFDVMNVDHKQYIAEKQYMGVAKKRVPQWKVSAGRAQDELKKEQERLLTIARNNDKENQRLTDASEELLAKQIEINAVSEQNERSERFLRLFSDRYDRLIKAFKNQDHTQVSRTANRLIKAVSESQNMPMPEKNAQEVNDMISAVNKHLEQKIPTFRSKPRFR